MSDFTLRSILSLWRILTVPPLLSVHTSQSVFLPLFSFCLSFFFFILCGSAPPPSICLQHQCFHFLPPPSQPPLTIHFSFCHSSPLVFNLLCLFPPALSLPVTINLCHYISFSLCPVRIGPAVTNFGPLAILLERTVNKSKIFKTVLLHIFLLPKF